MTDHGPLLARIAARGRADAGDDLPPPLDQTAIDRAEERLGFRLHPLLAAVYREVANGGFGPDCRLLSLVGGPHGERAVDEYLAARDGNAGTPWAWPEGVLPILSWGCGMYACVDCRSERGTVLLFEPNPGDPDGAWFVDTDSVEAWFGHYVDGTGWWDVMENGGEPDEMPLWAEARSRGST